MSRVKQRHHGVTQHLSSTHDCLVVVVAAAAAAVVVVVVIVRTVMYYLSKVSSWQFCLTSIYQGDSV
jgi:hypothetical protein